MQKAIWNGKIIYAYRVAEDYDEEKLIRKASERGEIMCPDENCPHRIYKYCNGDKKSPYFAHRENADCDYTKFEKNFGIMENLTLQLAKILENNGFIVKIHEKVFKGHITYIMAWKEGETPVAIDFITHKKGVEDIEGWANSYENLNIPYSFIVADKNLDINSEKNTFFAKRYSLNETQNKYLLIISWEGNTITQIAMDRGEYIYKEQQCPFPDELRDIYYKETTDSRDITIEDYQITIAGFSERFADWRNKRLSFFEDWKDDYEKQLLEEAEREKREREEEALRAKHAEEARKKAEEEATLKAQIAKEKAKAERERAFDIFNDHLSEKLDESDVALIDPDGAAWLKCRECGLIGNPVDFISEYNGSKLRNPGICKKCLKNKDEERERIRQERMNKPKICPKCGSRLVLKTAKKGKKAGLQFWGCTGFRTLGCTYSMDYYG